MNIAMNEGFRIAYSRADEVLANIKISRDGLVDVNEVLNYIRSSYFPDRVQGRNPDRRTAEPDYPELSEGETGR